MEDPPSEERPENVPPRLLDRRRLRAELGVSEAMADRIFRHLPVVKVPGSARQWVKRDDLERALDRWTEVEK